MWLAELGDIAITEVSSTLVSEGDEVTVKLSSGCVEDHIYLRWGETEVTLESSSSYGGDSSGELKFKVPAGSGAVTLTIANDEKSVTADFVYAID